ncbi:MAG: hypothetical protein Devi2KO_40830 [Devosia indica]
MLEGAEGGSHLEGGEGGSHLEGGELGVFSEFDDFCYPKKLG